jgi:hypothetical protein
VYFVVWFLPGNSPVYEFCIPTFRNTLSVPSSLAGRYKDGTDSVPKRPPMKMGLSVPKRPPMKIGWTVCSETSAYEDGTDRVFRNVRP